MRYAFRIATLFGIPIRLHITFVFLVLLVAIGALEPIGLAAGVVGLAVITILFSSVVLHELGHSLVAKAFRIPVREIVLLPIGGVASIAVMPRKAWQEFLIAIAGPLVSFALGFIGLAGLFYTGEALRPEMLLESHYLGVFTLVNLSLGIFNMAPAFPLDGGRILRSLLAMVIDPFLATRTAVFIGQAAAIAAAFFGLVYGFYALAIIAVFVYFGASMEERHVLFLNALRNVTNGQAALTRFVSLEQHFSLAQVLHAMMHHMQDDFPVVDSWGELVGVMPRRHCFQLMQTGHPPDTLVREVMLRDYIAVQPEALLTETVRAMQEHAMGMAVVLEEKRPIGLLTMDQIVRYHQLLATSPRVKVG